MLMRNGSNKNVRIEEETEADKEVLFEVVFKQETF